MSKRKKIKNIKDKSLPSFKREFLEDIDQFLLDDKIADLILQKNEAKVKAWETLDKLIQEDLSQVKLLAALSPDRSAVKPNTASAPPPQKINPEKIVAAPGASTHVLDLRPFRKLPPVDKFKLYQDKLKAIQASWWPRPSVSRPSASEKNPAGPEPRISFHFPQIDWPQWPEFSFLLLVRKTIIFALITALLLLPLRGLVVYQQISDDKDKVINYSRNGFLKLQTGVISASENAYESAQSDFQQSLESFQQAQGVIANYQKWLVDASTWLPGIGKPLSLSRNLLSASTNISAAATLLNQKAQSGDSPTEYLAVTHENIDKTIPYLESASHDLSALNILAIPEDFQKTVSVLRENLTPIISNLKTLNNVFSVLIDFLGHDTEKRYLVLFQNNNELRATGGFIGSIALLDVYQGKIVHLDIPKGGTYDLAYGQKYQLRAPRALSIINTGFNIWDANWWPDYPTSAEKINEFYNNIGGSSLDGVIAINAEVLRQLLAVMGPVTLEKYHLVVSADNFYQVIQQEVEVNYDKEKNEPKAIIADLAPLVLDKLVHYNEQQKDLITVLAQMLDQKNIQLFSNDANLESRLRSLSWAGEMAENDKDFLAVVSTNIAGGKTDNDIYQSIDHQAEILPSGEIINTVKVTRANQGQEDNPFAGMDGGNVSYLRFYVPLGSEFIEAIGFDQISTDFFRSAATSSRADADIAREEAGTRVDSNSRTEILASLDKTVFANWMTLRPGESQTVSIKYKLPFKLKLRDDLVNDWWNLLWHKGWYLDNYSLVVWKQSGVQNTIFNSTILLPDQVKVIWDNALEEKQISVTDQLVSYSQNMDKDIYFGFILASK